MNSGGTRQPMRERAIGKVAIEIDRLGGWLGWAARHPGIVLLGALAVTLLAVEESPKAEPVVCDSCEDEVPLFI